MPNPSLHVLRFALEENFAFEPGQYVTVGVHSPQDLPPRPYSIASSPHDSRSLEFYLKGSKEGDLTAHLLNLQPGQSIWYTGPSGRLTLSRSSHRVLFMIATGTGLAPFVSMIRQILAAPQTAAQPGYRVVLFHGVRSPQDLGYRDELEMWSSQHPSLLTYVPVISHPDPGGEFLPGWIQSRVDRVIRWFLRPEGDEDRGLRFGPGVDRRRLSDLLASKPAFYLCGHGGMILELRQILATHGHAEVFTEEW
jgi:ferredoxin-NADP reductase